jgi:hypothetical protein
MSDPYAIIEVTTRESDKMKIDQVPNAIRLGEVVVSPTPYKGTRYVLWDHKIKIEWDDAITRALRTSYLGWVYLIVVDGEIYKIGQSSASNGIEGTLSFYMSAGFDDAGINRFAINWMIRDEMDKGHKVQFYGIYQEPVVIETKGLFSTGHHKMISAKGMEAQAISDYVASEGAYPVWNYQESGNILDADISKAFGQYKIDRKAA